MGKEVVTIRLNGAEMDVPVQTTIGTLVDKVVHDRERVAVERNGEIVPRADYDATEVVEGDALEVVTLAGGG